MGNNDSQITERKEEDQTVGLLHLCVYLFTVTYIVSSITPIYLYILSCDRCCLRKVDENVMHYWAYIILPCSFLCPNQIIYVYPVLSCTILWAVQAVNSAESTEELEEPISSAEAF
jgi:hypothetical protein